VTYFRRRCSQKVHGSDAPVGFGDGQVADGVPYDEGIPMVSAAYSRASCSSAGRRLETGAASVSFWASIPCRKEREEGVRRRTGERGEDWDWREGFGSPDGGGIEWRWR
jgi:hypothetical protein